jgi:hypothetical protein
MTRITGAHIGGREEPINDEQGCDSDHCHAPTIMIRVLKNNRWVDQGPFPDPSPRKCGFGKIVLTTKSEITAASGVK